MNVASRYRADVSLRVYQELLMGAAPSQRGLAVALALTVTACFESGPLRSRTERDTTPTVTDTMHDTSPRPDTRPPDTVVIPPDTAATSPPDTIDVSDTTRDDTSLDDTTTDTAEVIVGPPCLSTADCSDVAGGTNKCRGAISCIDYTCREDPDGAVVCPQPDDACFSSTCVPATGECATEQVCQCAPAGVLPCDETIRWMTSDGSGTDALDTYSCDGAVGAGPEHAYSFSVPTAQRVRLTATAGAIDGVRVVRLVNGDCDGAQCVAAAPDVLLFNAEPGAAYAVVIEEAAYSGSVALRADCGITTEERCDDGHDDDGDGNTDCEDDECDTFPACIVPPDNETGLCFDTIDNDLDGVTDCSDDDCWSEPSCLQSCDITPVTVICGFQQGASTGGGKTRMEHYACGPPYPGKEIVYRFRPAQSGTVIVSMSSGFDLGLHVLENRGRGCTPLHCVDYGPLSVTFTASVGTDYYFAIDGPEGVSGPYDISVDCP